MISFPAGTEMFHFPAFALTSLCIQLVATGHDSRRVSPFRDPRIKGCLAPPRGLSQPTASFIASRRQGIHLLPLKTYPHGNCFPSFPLLPYSIVKEQTPKGQPDFIRMAIATTRANYQIKSHLRLTHPQKQCRQANIQSKHAQVHTRKLT